MGVARVERVGCLLDLGYGAARYIPDRELSTSFQVVNHRKQMGLRTGGIE